MINFIDVPDDLLVRDPAKLPNKLRYLQECAKRYKWKIESNPLPENSVPPTVPARTRFLCVFCNQIKTRADMIVEQLALDRQSWQGWCRSCSRKGRLNS